MDNKEIMDMLKLILEKVERLEKKGEIITVESGTFTINLGNASAVSVETGTFGSINLGDTSALSVENVDTVTIQGFNMPISVDHADEFSVHSAGGNINVNNNTEEN